MMGQTRLFYTKGSTIPPPPENVLTCSKMTGPKVFQSVLQNESFGSMESTAGKSLGSMEITVSTAAQTGRPDVIYNNNTLVGPEPSQVGSQAFSLTQDGGWIAALVVYSHLLILLLMSGKLMNMLWKAEAHHKNQAVALQQMNAAGAA